MSSRLFTSIKQDIKAKANTQRAVHDARFFKTGPGEYGEGDKFLDLTMPVQRLIAKKYAANATPSDIKALLYSAYHEERMVGWLILTYQYSDANSAEQENLFNFYLQHAHQANNWDLVDVTAPKVIGEHIKAYPKKRKVLIRLAEADNLWLKRIAILSTFPLIRAGEFGEFLSLAEKLLIYPHDLTHKAIGWMLREVGKKDARTLEKFLDKFAAQMPRTMLRYAIEKYTQKKRKYYLNKA